MKLTLWKLKVHILALVRHSKYFKCPWIDYIAVVTWGKERPQSQALIVNMAAKRHAVYLCKKGSIADGDWELKQLFQVQPLKLPRFPGACKCKRIHSGYIYMSLMTPVIFSLLKYSICELVHVLYYFFFYNSLEQYQNILNNFFFLILEQN